MKNNTELYNKIREEIYQTFAKGDIVVLSSYMLMIYDYWKKDWLIDEKKEMLFDLVHYSVKLLLERK